MACQKTETSPVRYPRGRHGRKTTMTLLEYLDAPETLAPRELAFGTLRVADSPRAPHQRLVGNLFLRLAPYVRDRRLGEMWIAPFDVVLDAEQALVVQPDLLFISAERAGIVTDHVYGAPDLVIEVLSPYPRIGRIEEKLEWYGRYRVRECWLVHQSRREIDVITWTAGVPAPRTVRPGDPIASSVLPDLVLRWEDIAGGWGGDQYDGRSRRGGPSLTHDRLPTASVADSYGALTSDAASCFTARRSTFPVPSTGIASTR